MPITRIGTNADDTLLGAALEDIIVARGGNDYADGGSGNDTILGGSGNDTVIGGLGNDSLAGEDGDDVLLGGAGDDTLLGGAGSDLLIWNNGDGSDTITGGSEVDTAVVNGGAGVGDAWTLAAGGMDALLSSASSGGSPLNFYQVEAIEAYGAGGDDRLVVGALTRTSLRQVYFEGGSGNDTLDGAASTIALIADGGDGSDSLTGGELADTLRGGGGADTIAGNRGVDLLEGGIGDDRFIWTFGDGGDRIIGGADQDTIEIRGTPADDYLTLQINGTGVVVGSDDAASTALQVSEVELIDVRGEDGADIFSVGGQSSATQVLFDGGRGADILDGGQALFGLRGNGGGDDDTLIGGSGNDILAGGGDDDVLLGGEGSNTLLGETGDDQIDGGGAADNLSGSLGDDTLNGGAGADVLSAGAGEDLIWGGAGADVFRFPAAELSNGSAEGDIIVDYSGAEGDSLDLPDGVSSVADAYLLNDKLVVVLDGDSDTIELVGVDDISDILFV
jgi:Ca2+-binding RTX toxin-like protein